MLLNLNSSAVCLWMLFGLLQTAHNTTGFLVLPLTLNRREESCSKTLISEEVKRTAHGMYH